jgi:hypothetical protein
MVSVGTRNEQETNMKSLDIKPDAYLENAARQLVELNKELAGKLSPDEEYMAETRQFDRVHIVEPITRRGHWNERYYAVYEHRGIKQRTQCSSLFNAQQIARRYKGKAIIVAPCEEK